MCLSQPQVYSSPPVAAPGSESVKAPKEPRKKGKTVLTSDSDTSAIVKNRNTVIGGE